jgi:hypothetical protein
VAKTKMATKKVKAKKPVRAKFGVIVDAKSVRRSGKWLVFDDMDIYTRKPKAKATK